MIKYDEIPTGTDPAGFLLPGFSFYGILCQERNGSQGIPVVNWRAFYYFSNTFDGRDKSRFATKSKA